MTLPARLTTDGNGETKCIVIARDFYEAKRALKPFASGVTHEFPFISAFGASVNVHKLGDLQRLPCVKAVAAHTTVTAADEGGGASDTHIAMSEISGAGVTVAVIDTGVRPHLDFMMPSVRIKRFVDFVDGRKNAYDDNGHGSAVAGLAVGNGLVSGGLFKGSAPRAELIALKAMNKKGEGSAFHILEAMQWIYANKDKENIRVAVMSFGTAPPTESDPLMLGAEALWRSGVVVVASAGNSGPKENTVTSPGLCPEIITVGAVGVKDGKIFVPDFSSRGKTGEFKPELVAAGVNIGCVGIDGHYSFLSGTSMAAPVVAGYCADIIASNPRYTPDKVKEVLIKNAQKLPYPSNVVGYGLAKI